MSRFLRCLWLGVAILLGAGFPASADASSAAASPRPSAAVSQPLTILAYNIPFFLESNSSGAMLNLMQEVGRRVGVTLTLEVLPASRANQAYRQGIGDGLMPVLVPRLAEFSDSYGATVPFFLKREFAFVRSGKEIPTTLDQFWGKTIGLTAGYKYGGGLREQHELLIEEAASDTANMRKLAAGRIDIFICEEYTALSLIRELGLDNIVYAPESPLAETEALLILRSRPGVEELAQRLKETLHEMRADRSYSRLIPRPNRQEGIEDSLHLSPYPPSFRPFRP